MPATTHQIDVRAFASAVMAALTDLQGYLSAAVNPDRIALADLEMEPMGWTKRVYSERAFEIWKKQIELFPDDPLILHHMAIMCHARAFDLESGVKPSESDADWEAALNYWQRLLETDAFWERLTEKACAGTKRQEVIQKLRAELPQKILAIHYDIALDSETRKQRPSRAKYHIAMVRKAKFDSRHRVEAQRAAYNQYIKSVPDEVWQPSELRENVLEKGQDAIIEYLKFDPGCLPALEDALRLQRRVQRSRNTLWRTYDTNDPRRKALLLLEKKDADAWRPFFDQLAAVVDNLEEDVREDLARWYHGRGGDLCALDEEEKAIEFYERAVAVCHPDDDGRKEHVRELVQTMAVAARAKAAKGDPDALVYSDKVRKRDDLTMIACWILAQAYVRLLSYDIAVEVCDKGLKIEPDFDDLAADEWIARLTKFKREIPVHRLLSQAAAAMKADNEAQAVPLLNEAESMAKKDGILRENNSIYWLRAQAHLALRQISEARRDVELFSGLLDKESSKDDIAAGVKLKEMIAQAENAFRECGGAEASRFRQQAIGAFNAGQHQEAIKLLRSALDASKLEGHRGGAKKIKEELSIVLTGAAIELTNKAQEAAIAAQKSKSRFGGSNFDFNGDINDILCSLDPLAHLKKKMKEVDDMLSEATQLDPSNAKAEQTLQQVRDLVNKLP